MTHCLSCLRRKGRTGSVSKIQFTSDMVNAGYPAGIGTVLDPDEVPDDVEQFREDNERVASFAVDDEYYYFRPNEEGEAFNYVE